MKTLLNTILGATAMLCFTLTAAAQTPATSTTPKKVIKEEVKVEIKKADKIVPANPSATSTTTTQESKKGTGGRTRAISIDEEGVNEESQDERPAAAPAGGGTSSTRASAPRKAQAVTPRR